MSLDCISKLMENFRRHSRLLTLIINEAIENWESDNELRDYPHVGTTEDKIHGWVNAQVNISANQW